MCSIRTDLLKQENEKIEEIREDDFRFWCRRVHEDASQGMHMSKIEILVSLSRTT
jgi:hypothetical protein